MAKNLIHYNILYNFLQLSPDKTKYVLKKISKCKEYISMQLILNKLKIKQPDREIKRSNIKNTIFKIPRNLILRHSEVLDKLCLTSTDINNMIINKNIKYIKSPDKINEIQSIIQNIIICCVLFLKE